MSQTNYTPKTLLLFIILIGTTSISCKKYLDKKPLKGLAVPTSLADLTALSNSIQINANGPALTELVSDNLYITTADFQLFLNDYPDLCLNYIWDADAPPHNLSWNSVYQFPVYYSNIILDQLNEIFIKQQEKIQAEALRGGALFRRAFAFYQLAQLFCKPYSSTADNDPGIPLKLSSSITEKIVRPTVAETYRKIIMDLQMAVDLLPNESAIATIPNKPAAFALLSRVYLSMRQYDKAGIFADSCLRTRTALLDYNNLIPVKAPPVNSFNTEVIYHNCELSTVLTQNTRAKIDSNLYKSYTNNDLRKQIFFKENTGVGLGTFAFQGSYHGNSNVDLVFNGLTTSEAYLIRAECCAREGKIQQALADLNELLKHRYKNDGAWTPYVGSSQQEVLELILTERRKELVYRGQRWMDIRRLNLEHGNISLMRKINDVVYTLPENDIRSIMLIPWESIERSNLPQNIRKK